MKYIIDEEELRKLPQYTINTCDEISVDDAITELIKHKQPVEMVASGEVKDDSILPGIVSYIIGDMDDLKIFYKIYGNQGKSIEIYIKEIK